MKHYSNIIIKPVISENSYAEANFENKYTFVVAESATKTDVKNAIESIFGVNVKSVSTSKVKGSKTKNTKTRRIVINTTYKKARVLLPKGQKIAIFEEATKEEDKKPKEDKNAKVKTEKKAKKGATR